MQRKFILGGGTNTRPILEVNQDKSKMAVCPLSANGAIH